MRYIFFMRLGKWHTIMLLKVEVTAIHVHMYTCVCVYILSTTNTSKNTCMIKVASKLFERHAVVT